MPEESSTPTFQFDPAFAESIAHVANSWATTEYYINDIIWSLAKTDPAIGACLTSSIYTFAARINTLLALMKLRRVDQKIIDRVNKFAESSRAASELRNRIVHDMWLHDSTKPDLMGKLETTAQKKLIFKIQEVSLEKLKGDQLKIEECRSEAFAIRNAIKAALPSLPAIPQTELHPVVETPAGQ